MSNLNINRKVADAFYRYKMPRIIAKVEGKGNGIKTAIVNMSEIAKALSRPPAYLTKYFGYELGTQTMCDNKNDRYIVNGEHTSDKLQNLLDGFVHKFVLCPDCDNPETNLTVKKNSIFRCCTACGHVCIVDMRHKLTTFIVKNFSEQDPGFEKASRVVERCTSAEWGEDTAVKAHQEATKISGDLEKSTQKRVDRFYLFVNQMKVAGQMNEVKHEKEIVLEAERLEIRDKAPLVLAELLYDTNIIAQIKQHCTLFCRLTHNSEKAQRYLLRAFEQLVGVVHPAELMPKVPYILKAFYDNDILDESVIVEWNQKPSRSVTEEISKEIHNKAAPFIQWLEQAEEEESSEEDGDGVVPTAAKNEVTS